MIPNKFTTQPQVQANKSHGKSMRNSYATSHTIAHSQGKILHAVLIYTMILRMGKER
jgi:hypothetical protein